jgi:hypothetical protein
MRFCSQLDGRLKSNRRPGLNHEQQLGSPKQFGGMLADINTAHIVPIDPNPQNAQLFHCCKLLCANVSKYSSNHFKKMSSVLRR